MVKFPELTNYIQSLSPGEWDDAVLLSRLKCEKQLKSMIEGARAAGERRETCLLSVALLFRLFTDLKRSWEDE